MYFSYSPYKILNLKIIDIFNSVLCYLCLYVYKLRLYDKKIGKFGFHKNGAGIGENAYQVRYGFYFAYALQSAIARTTVKWPRYCRYGVKHQFIKWQRDQIRKICILLQLIIEKKPLKIIHFVKIIQDFYISEGIF